MTSASPREGMMAVVRNRRAMITGVQPFDADEAGRYHLVEVEYTDGTGVETDARIAKYLVGKPKQRAVGARHQARAALELDTEPRKVVPCRRP